MEAETISVSRAEWNGVSYRSAHLVDVEAERVGEHFAIHKCVEPLSGYRYTVTHVKTGWALCRTLKKSEARRAARMAEEFPGIDWAKLTHKSQQTPSVRERGCELLMALSFSGLAADIRVVNNKPKRIP